MLEGREGGGECRDRREGRMKDGSGGMRRRRTSSKTCCSDTGIPLPALCEMFK